VFVDLGAGEVSTFISSHRWLAQLLLLDVGIKRYVRQFPLNRHARISRGRWCHAGGEVVVNPDRQNYNGQQNPDHDTLDHFPFLFLIRN
jgi:hypothetical protein